jgi:Barstar (barnase inhibitor)
MNQIIIDLTGIKNKEQVLFKLGDFFEFGGPNGNHSVSLKDKSGWGLNWDALNDSLRVLEIGGIWGTSKKFEFPLKIIFDNSHELQESDPATFKTLNDILEQEDHILNFEFK